MTAKSTPLVAHIIYSLGTGGLENGLINIINRTPAERYRHVIICLTTAQEFARRINTPGVRVVELNKRDGHDWGMYRRLLRILKELRPDIIHTRNLAALDTQVLGVLLPGVKQVHGEHGRDMYDLDGSNLKYRCLRRLMRFFVDRYIVVSRDLERWLIESIGVKRQYMHQIYNGVDQHRFRSRGAERPLVFPPEIGIEEPAVVIGTVGRLVEVKDQRLILEAVQLLLQREDSWRRKLRVVLVGDGPLAGKLKRRASELGLTDIVWMPGDREDIPALLQAMDVFVLPSLGEGISNTILEAMASGLPVVATDVGGNPELVVDGFNGRLFPVGDARALSSILHDLINSEEERFRLGRQALAGVRNRFDWDRTVSEYLHVYDELLGKAEAADRNRAGLACVDDMRA